MAQNYKPDWYKAKDMSGAVLQSFEAGAGNKFPNA